MTMTKEEIVRDYKAAKTPAKQIAVLADLNVCSRKEIVEILREAGCELPAYYHKKKQPELLSASSGSEKREEPVPVVQAKPAPAPKTVSLRHAAIDTIANLLAQTDDTNSVDFMENVRGVLALVWMMEQKEEA